LRLEVNRFSGVVGLFMQPTVLTGVTREMRVAREEIFGPVLSVLTFETAEEAVAIANETLYGLSAAVWSGTSHLPDCGRRHKGGYRYG